MPNYTRKCPNCDNTISYKSLGGFNLASKKNSICRQCTSKKTGFTARYATKGQNLGKDNAFYGKTHKEETKLQIVKDRDYSKYKTKEFRKKISEATKGKNNPMSGRTHFDIWVKKYGYEQAELLEKERRKKASDNSSGEKNNMYGKPSPNGAGNGWKGYFNNIYCRSLREVMFLITKFEENVKCIPGENIVIKYVDYNGRNRTYRPDFIIGSTLYEIKPQKLINTPLVKLKTEAAIKYCEENNLTYIITDINIDKDLIEKYIQKGIVKLDARYKTKFDNH